MWYIITIVLKLLFVTILMKINSYGSYFVFLSVVCGSWFEHFLSWEKHRNDENILFLFYEDMKKVTVFLVTISVIHIFHVSCGIGGTGLTKTIVKLHHLFFCSLKSQSPEQNQFITQLYLYRIKKGYISISQVILSNTY